MDKVTLLTVKDLAARWQKDEGTIRRYIAEKTITPCKNVPGMMFHPSYIAKLEGVELDKFSPLERRRMQRRIEDLETIVKLQNEQLRKVAMLGTESMNLLQKIMIE
ncbi:histidine kinase [Clostridium sp. UBA7339]|uniref:histidine kinase n=1 Tax=Clostridium sp. UBA7339 TaxID=1946376 RepID=UPI0032163EE2